MPEPAALLADVFGFDSFRPGQEEIVSAVADGQNTLAIMPTGGGKSLCFQLPALCREGVTLVISPLIALMRDQVRSLSANGVAAGALTSGNTESETEAVHAALRDGRLKLLYLAPERLAATGMQAFLKRIGVGLIAVDEAHCVSQWGHDFRPDYLRIGELRRALGVPLAAFTATADAETRAEITSRLFGGEAPQVFLRGFDRPNLHLAFMPKNQPRAQIEAYAAARRGRSGIIYCGTRAKTESLAAALTAQGHSAVAYHGGLDPSVRRDVEERFAAEDGLIVVGTVAFGMGVDKPDVRWVAHADLPKSIEAYYQEIGRAGRDGAPAETLTLYGPDDIRYRRQQIDESPAPLERKAADHARLNALLGLAEARGCRRKVLLGYFGECLESCGACDQCERPPELFDGTVPVQKALSAILRTEERFGAGHVIDVVMGHETEKVRQHRHHLLPTFGAGTDMNRPAWQGILRQMMAYDLVRPDPARHGALRMTEHALPILKGSEAITLRRDALIAKTRATAKALVAEEDAGLLAALKAKRRALAQAQNVPAYVVFSDRTLIEMAQRRPSDLDEMMDVPGVGAKKLEKYGTAFLSVVTGETAGAQHPVRRKLAGHCAGALFDRLTEVQAGLARGPEGTDKPLGCSAPLLARVAAQRPRSQEALTRLLGERRAERFGEAFLAVLRER